MKSPASLKPPGTEGKEGKPQSAPQPHSLASLLKLGAEEPLIAACETTVREECESAGAISSRRECRSAGSSGGGKGPYWSLIMFRGKSCPLRRYGH